MYSTAESRNSDGRIVNVDMFVYMNISSRLTEYMYSTAESRNTPDGRIVNVDMFVYMQSQWIVLIGELSM